MPRPSALLTIGGFDPSGGAGILRDFQTMEAAGCRCVAAITAITAQNSSTFSTLTYLPWAQIEEQLNLLFMENEISHAKIGLIQWPEMLRQTLSYLKAKNIRWVIIDPIIGASAGFEFHSMQEVIEFKKLMAELWLPPLLLTPNKGEAKILGIIDQSDPTWWPTGVDASSTMHHVIIKSKDSDGKSAVDEWILPHSSDSIRFSIDFQNGLSRHGTGCVYSSALLANLAHGAAISSSIIAAQNATQYYIDNGEPEKSKKIAFPKLMLIVDEEWASPQKIEFLTAMGERGLKWIQLRFKNRPELLPAAIAKLSGSGFHLCINDDVSAAFKSGTAVHLGKNDMDIHQARALLGSHAIIGGTANTPAEVQYLRQAKIDYIGAGPFKFTTTKKNLSPVIGKDGLKRLRLLAGSLPIFAVGGITVEDVDAIMSAGCAGIAVSSAITQDKNPLAAFSAFKAKLDKW